MSTPPSQPGTPAGPDPDLEFVQAAQAGKRESFEELYRRHVKQVFNLVYRMVHTAQEAEEVTQEVFYQAYKNLGSFQGKSRFYTWLYRIAMNVCYQHSRKEQRRSREAPFDDLLDKSDTAPYIQSTSDPVKEVEERETFRALEAALKELPDNQRAVLVLGPIQGHNYEEMSQILGVSTEVIKARLHRARENIRARLKGMRSQEPEPAQDAPPRK